MNSSIEPPANTRTAFLGVGRSISTLQKKSITATVPIQIQCVAVLQSSIFPAPNPAPGEAVGFAPSIPVPFPSVSIPVPGILVNVLAEAFKAVSDNRGLFRESQEGLLLCSDIEFVTFIGRSNMVYASVPFRRKFWRIEIFLKSVKEIPCSCNYNIHYKFHESYFPMALHSQLSSQAIPN